MKRSLVAACGLLVALVLVAVLAERPRRTPAGQPALASIAGQQDVAHFWADFDRARDHVRAVAFLSPS